jgi:hypothetical protein
MMGVIMRIAVLELPLCFLESREICHWQGIPENLCYNCSALRLTAMAEASDAPDVTQAERFYNIFNYQ